MSTPEHAFQELSRIFSTRQNRILEFEILSPSLGLGPLLQDGCSIGLTKKALVQAFVVARRVFFGFSVDADYGAEKSRPDDELLVSSEILLLFDCEHLTACNWRKKRLAALIHSHASNADSSGHEKLIETLESELTLLTTYVCSPLHRHTKSPTLWQHRFWTLTQLVKLLQSSPVQSTKTQDQSRPSQLSIPELFTAELAIALRAGELHPKNYYAFNYTRQLHRALSNIWIEADNSFELLAKSVITAAVDWCLAHPRDISGWMFVLYLMQVVGEDVRADVISRVLRFALDVGWEGESLWTFVDLAVRAFGGVDSVQRTLQTTQDMPLSPVASNTIEGNLPEKHWEIWLARAKVYWAACSST